MVHESSVTNGIRCWHIKRIAALLHEVRIGKRYRRRCEQLLRNLCICNVRFLCNAV